jgi:hypothetical protein
MTEAEWLTCSDPASMLGLLVARGSVRKLRLFGVACCRRAEVGSRRALAGRGIDLAERLADGLKIEEDLTLFLSDLLYEGFSGWDALSKREQEGMAGWHHALAVFNALQDAERYRAGERRPVFDDYGEEDYDLLLHFALSDTLKRARPGTPVFDRPDICRPDLTRVWQEAARSVAYHRHPDDYPEMTLVETFTKPDARRRLEDWAAALKANVRLEAEQQALLARDIFGNPFRPVTADPAWLTSTVVALARGIDTDRAFDRLPILADALQDAGCDDHDVLSHCRGGGPHVRGCWVVDVLLDKGHEPS